MRNNCSSSLVGLLELLHIIKYWCVHASLERHGCWIFDVYLVWGLKNLYTMLHIAVSTFKVPMGEDSSSLSTKDNVLADELRLYRRCPSCIRWSHFPIHQCTQNGTHNLTKSLQHFGKSAWNVYINWSIYELNST